MRQSGYIFAGDYGGDDGGGSSGVSCQDCGNKAKKDCQHIRCRTCCRNRGLPCKTHVKSTWVPAAKRRERHQQIALSTEQQNSGDLQQLSLMTASDDGVAMPVTHLHNTGFDRFPAEVHSPAVFRCFKVSGIEETNEQLAYQTAISIGGHVFTGILYDQGPDHGQYSHPEGESSSVDAGTSGGGRHQDVNVITSGTTATTTTSIFPAVTVLDPTSMYPTPLCAFMAGTQFFPPPRS